MSLGIRACLQYVSAEQRFSSYRTEVRKLKIGLSGPSLASEASSSQERVVELIGKHFKNLPCQLLEPLVFFGIYR